MGSRNARRSAGRQDGHPQGSATAAPLGGGELAAHLTQLEHRVNRILVEPGQALETLGLAIGAICEALDWDVSRYWALDQTERALRLRRVWSRHGALHGAARQNETVLERGQGLIGTACEHGRPIWFPDVLAQKGARREEIDGLAGCASALLIPARADDGVLGVLEFRAAHIPEPDEVLLQALGVLGPRVAATYARQAEMEHLRESDECNNSTFELAAIGISHVGERGRLIHVNRRLCEMLGYTREELVGRTVKEISHPDDVDVTDEKRARLRAGEISSFAAEKRYLRKDGTPIWVGITVAVRRDALGEPMYDVSAVEDISERKAAEEALRASEAFYHGTFELAAIGIAHVASDGTLLHANRQLCEMLGYSRDELVGRTVKEISHPDDVSVTDEDRDKLRAGEIEAFKLEKRYLCKDGTPIWVKITVAQKKAPDGGHLYDVSIVEDISDRKAAEARIEYLATHDEMTKLPNRAMFSRLLHNAVASAIRYGQRFGVLFIDLDRFKLINDSLGHDAGDMLLKEMSSRFRECVRESDVVARLGGDEFVMLVQGVDDEGDVSLVARKILSAALQPVDIGGQECRVTASIGICTFPDEASDVQSLMKNADIAMYLAKEEGKNNFQFYSEAINSRSIERLALENALRRALERQELFIHYQPKVNVGTGEIGGVEALLRWNNAELGSVSPAQFIPLAEEMGLILPIGKWVLKNACEQNMAWQRDGLPPVIMAVNLSPRQFRDPDLVRDVADVLDGTGMPAELLELEITEGMLMRDVDKAVEKLNELKEMGVRLSIDDFGTGYSSLAQLKRLPIDTLKIDRSFIRHLPENAEDKAITEAIISMGRTLGVSVIAEGVETSEQQSYLKSRECDQIQGFYFSRPSHPAEVADRLRRQLRHPDGP